VRSAGPSLEPRLQTCVARRSLGRLCFSADQHAGCACRATASAAAITYDCPGRRRFSASGGATAIGSQSPPFRQLGLVRRRAKAPRLDVLGDLRPGPHVLVCSIRPEKQCDHPFLTSKPRYVESRLAEFHRDRKPD